MKKIEIPEGTDLNKIINNLNQSKNVAATNEQNFHFENWIFDALPDPFPQLIASIDSSAKKDTALLASLTVLSALIKNYKVDYDGKMEDCQLYTYILGDPAQGKGSVAKYRKLGSSFHTELIKKFQEENELYKVYMQEWEHDGKKGEKPIKPQRCFLYLSVNSSKASFIKDLEANNGYGLIFETEADTVYAANKSDFGGFSDILRKGFHSEDLSVNRASFEDGAIEIEHVILSVVLTSTLDQCFKLMSTYENGLFSRFIFYVLPQDLKFNNVFGKKDTKLNDLLIKKTDDLFKSIGDQNLNPREKCFSLTDSQKEKFHTFFEFINNAMIENQQVQLKGSINRLGLIFTRLCMLLSYLRNFQKGLNIDKTIFCTDTDFEIILSIVKKLINHLLFVDDLYHSKNPSQQNSQLIHAIPKNNRYSNETKLKAIKLRKTKMSYSQIAKEVLNNPSLKGTIQKWCESKTPFPVSETETDSKKINTRSVLNKTIVSFFDTVDSKHVDDNYSLLTLLTSDLFSSMVEDLRNAKSEDRKELKKKMPAFTPSGSFNKVRKKETFLKHSNFICIDIDLKENNHLDNFDCLKQELSKIVNLAYIGQSVSGEGYFVIIPIDKSDLHDKYFVAIEEAFNYVGIVIDKACKDITRLRIVSHDEDAIIPKETTILNKILDKKEKMQAFEFIDHDQFNELIDAIEISEIDITQSYHDWFSISCAIANTFDEEGRQYFHKLSKFYNGYNETETDKQFDACLKQKSANGYTLSTLFYVANNYGIDY